MDVLNDILDTLDLRGAFYFRTHFSAPWAVTVPNLAQAARFHLVVHGACHVVLPDGAGVTLGPGDLVLVPRGRTHVLADCAGRVAPTLETVLECAGYQGDGVLVVGSGDPEAATQLVCGHFTFRSGSDHPLLRALPDIFVNSAAARACQPLLDEILRMVTKKAFSDDIGSTAALTRLSEIVFIELLRGSISQSESLRAVLEGLGDRYISRSLKLMHSRPSEAWTVERLASEIGMSRSRFAERFSDLMGLGPMAYLAEWRLQKAISLLNEPSSRVQKIANATGYRSAAAFTRAFARKFGYPPSDLRRISN